MSVTVRVRVRVTLTVTVTVRHCHCQTVSDSLCTLSSALYTFPKCDDTQLPGQGVARGDVWREARVTGVVLDTTKVKKAA